MAAALVRKEELAIAFKAAILKGYTVIVIVTMEGKVELIEAEALPVFGIAFGFLAFSDQSIVHCVAPF
jgi:hypothetical protein